MAERLAVLALSLVLLAELGFAVVTDGLTYDEVAYIASGYRYLTAGDFGVNPEQPPLAKLLAAAPLLPLRPAMPEAQPGESLWRWSQRFVLAENDPARVVPRARAPFVILTLLLALGVWAWGRAVAGPAAGLFALALAVFHPSLLAHGHLATTDLAATAAMLAASWAHWRWWSAPTAGRAVLVALFLGVGAATRPTTLLLLPAFLGIALVEWRAGTVRPGMGRRALVLVGLCGAIGPLAIWASYGFHSPRLYLEGLARYLATSREPGHFTYLLGRSSASGWPHYYLVALLVKNTPGFLVAVAMGLWLLVRGRASGGARTAWHWIAPAAVVLAAASAQRIQVGERYVLPVYPYLILIAASAVPWLLSRGWGRVALAGALLAHAVTSLAAAPGGYLSYFNLLAGGRRGAHRVLIDSNLDWGQDLPRLAHWMKARGVEEVQLGYFGRDDPGRYGIRHHDLPGSHFCAAGPAPRPLEGIVAVSPNLLFSKEIANDLKYAPYEALAARPPDARAGVFFIYMPPAAARR